MASSPLTSGRTVCPHCGSPLTQAKPGGRGSVQAHVIAEPECFVAWHLSRTCPRACKRATYWCGYVAFFQPGVGKRGRKHKHVDSPDPAFFFFSASNGVARSWLRRWRYRLYLHRASFQAEATLLRLLHVHVRKRLREQLRQLWARELLCRRAVEAGVSDAFFKQALNAPLEVLIAKAWDWYEPLMFSRCLVGPMRVDVGTNSLTSNNSITLVHVGPSRSKCPFTTGCVFKMAFLTVASPHSPHGQIHNLCQLGSQVRLCRFGVRQ